MLQHSILVSHRIWLMILLILSLFVVPAVANAFFFKMEESIRLDLNE